MHQMSQLILQIKFKEITGIGMGKLFNGKHTMEVKIIVIAININNKIYYYYFSLKDYAVFLHLKYAFQGCQGGSIG